MSMFKKTKVVMLPVKDKSSKLLLSFKIKGFNQLNEPKLTLIEKANHQLSNIHPQHLYFLSDEGIEEGDWIFNSDMEPSIIQCIGKGCLRGWSKIIATTDKSLSKTIKSSYVQFGDNVEETRIEFLPKPSQSFVEAYVEEYNKGNIIQECMVEYEEDGDFEYQGKEYINWSLKVSKHNTITIRKVKDS